jgi:phosphoribosylformimino-5-aminoimidazole carboxamide ribonucleotide (ProFAR) isomerase
MRKFAEHGLSAQSCLVGLDGLDDSEGMVIAALQSHALDCVVVGGGIRTAEDQRELFERVINQIRCHAPQAAIAFNATPADTYDAAARWVGPSRAE